MTELEFVKPEEIEARSFEIIGQELERMGKVLPEENGAVIRRVIHTTADFDFADTLVFTDGAVRAGLGALRAGCSIVTDTNMAKAGISSRALGKLGGTVRCFMAEPETFEAAKRNGTTRAAASMDRAAELPGDVIIAVGNAPTALIRLYDLIREGRIRPKLIIGCPVGFVNVVAAKELILSQTEVPCIVASGRKGGSTVAAAVVNALLYQLTRG